MRRQSLHLLVLGQQAGLIIELRFKHYQCRLHLLHVTASRSQLFWRVLESIVHFQSPIDKRHNIAKRYW